ELLGEVTRGGADVARAAGAFVLGGHSVDDPEPKYGMAAVGEARPDKIVTNAGAGPGDVLVLTKPLGTGVLTTALKRDLVSEADLAEAVSTMTTLNAGAARAMLTLGGVVHAATDVTGFGLLGHLRTLLEASKAAAEIEAAAVPLLTGARELAQRGAGPGGTARNLESAAGTAPGGAAAPRHRVRGRRRAARNARTGGSPPGETADDRGAAGIPAARARILRRAALRMFTRLLVGLDGSPRADSAFEQAVFL